MIVDRRISKLIVLLLPVCCHCNTVRDEVEIIRTDAKTAEKGTQELSKDVQMSAAIDADGMIQEFSQDMRDTKTIGNKPGLTKCCYKLPEQDHDFGPGLHELHDRYGQLREGDYDRCECQAGAAPEKFVVEGVPPNVRRYESPAFVAYATACNPCPKHPNTYAANRQRRSIELEKVSALRAALKSKAGRMQTEVLARGLAEFLSETLEGDKLWMLARKLNMKEGPRLVDW